MDEGSPLEAAAGEPRQVAALMRRGTDVLEGLACGETSVPAGRRLRHVPAGAGHTKAAMAAAPDGDHDLAAPEQAGAVDADRPG